MFAVVQFDYAEGRKAHFALRVVGQIHSDFVDGVPVLRLWPIDYKHDCRDRFTPHATLWHFTLVAVTEANICLRGLELVQRGQSRRWCAQKWLCDVHDSQSARAWLKPDPRISHD